MNQIKLSSGVVHTLPADVRQTLLADRKLPHLWNDLTPLARNEWICWIISVKQEATRQKHLVRLQEDLKAGKRRPCCWPGCPHRQKK